jgi:hypothetical protein
MPYETWIKKVNTLCESEFGFDTESFSDYTWLDCFDDGMTPDEAFKDWCDSDYGPES